MGVDGPANKPLERLGRLWSHVCLPSVIHAVAEYLKCYAPCFTDYCIKTAEEEFDVSIVFLSTAQTQNGSVTTVSFCWATWGQCCSRHQMAAWLWRRQKKGSFRAVFYILSCLLIVSCLCLCSSSFPPIIIGAEWPSRHQRLHPWSKPEPPVPCFYSLSLIMQTFSSPLHTYQIIMM